MMKKRIKKCKRKNLSILFCFLECNTHEKSFFDVYIILVCVLIVFKNINFFKSIFVTIFLEIINVDSKVDLKTHTTIFHFIKSSI